jgi:hypothetical protein
MIPPICYAKLINIAATSIDDLCTLLVLTVKRRFLLILSDSLDVMARVPTRDRESQAAHSPVTEPQPRYQGSREAAITSANRRPAT